MNRSPLLVAVALAALLAACSHKPYPPERALAPAADATAPAPPGAAPAAATAGSGSTWSGTYPYGTAEGATESPAQAAAAPQSAPAPATGPAPAPAAAPAGGEVLARATDTGGGSITVYSAEDEEGERSPLAPFVSGWAKPGISPDQHRADIEACYRYAWSQVEHDLRIESDVAAARDDEDKGLGLTAITQRMNLYDHKERRTELINDCMESKGYVQR